MRVIAGIARSMPLQTIEGKDTRPTTDRIKETLFNMLQNQVPGSRFLDLFSGSGGIGIEALSRGATEAVLVEKQPKACACIKKNLEFTKLADRAVLMETDALTAIRRLDGSSPFDLIYMDPPYAQGLEQDTLAALAKSTLVNMDTVVLVEAGLDTDFSFLPQTGLEIFREKRYKTNRHLFCRKEDI